MLAMKNKQLQNSINSESVGEAICINWSLERYHTSLKEQNAN
jgi:hypothetical protein